MPVNPIQPIVIPEKIADKYWMSEIIIRSPIVGGEAHAEIVLVPYVSSTNERAGPRKVVKINDILSRVQNGDQTLLSAYQSIEAAVQEELNNE